MVDFVTAIPFWVHKMDTRNSLIFSIVVVLMLPKDADGLANSEGPDLGCLVLCVQFFKIFYCNTALQIYTQCIKYNNRFNIMRRLHT